MRGGYSLVEISLALLVMGVGLIAVFALFPEGLSQGRKSVDETQVAEFAAFVMASMATEAALATNATLWNNIKPNAQFGKAKTHALSLSDQQPIQAKNNVNFNWRPNYYAGTEYLTDYDVAQFKYSLSIDTYGALKTIRLSVSPAAATNQTRVFYTEILAPK